MLLGDLKRGGRVVPLDPICDSCAVSADTGLLRKPLVNTNAEVRRKHMAASRNRGAVGEMEAVWPSGAVLREKAPNHHEGPWLKTVVLSVVGKGVARPHQVRTGKMSDER